MRPTALLCLLLLLAAVSGVEYARRGARPAGAAADSCTVCHRLEEETLSTGHPAAAMGCSPCHLGNGLAHDKDRAHYGMVKNPGDLRVVDATCGRGGCHPERAARVKTSVMATASGILASLDGLWGTRGPRDAATLWTDEGRDPPRDYWAKLCAACHLWWPKGRGLGEQRLRGGGCAACHMAGPAGEPPEASGALRHARLVMLPPMENCVRCHNRSARIGLTYQGLAEVHVSGGSRRNTRPDGPRLSGGRLAMRVEPDAHFAAGMACIDCHTGAEVMGDGRAHPGLRGQLDVSCADCHTPRFEAAADAGPDGKAARAEAERLAALVPALPALDRAPLARTARKGSPLYALRPDAPPHGDVPGRAVLLRKADGKPLPVALHERPKPHHALRGHERLGCQACHSPLMPQCYGCHVTLHPDETQADLLLGRETPGRWRERLDYSRLLGPALGLRGGKRVVPFSPCQVFASTLGRDGAPVVPLARARMAMTSFDPHSTRLRSRTCQDCHQDTRTLGLGAASLPDGGGPRPASTGRAPAPGGLAPLEVFVTPDGRAVQDFPGPGDRPLNGGELAAVLGVAPCLPCHGDYDDPVYRDFAASRMRLFDGGAPACRCPEPARMRRADAGPGVQVHTLTRDTVFQNGPVEHTPKGPTHTEQYNTLNLKLIIDESTGGGWYRLCFGNSDPGEETVRPEPLNRPEGP